MHCTKLQTHIQNNIKIQILYTSLELSSVKNGEKFINHSIAGACYLDFPDDILKQNVSSDKILPATVCPPPPLLFPDPQSIQKAAAAIRNASRPLVIVGKGKPDKLLASN